MLYPHFSDRITPGWFDKMFKKRQANPENQARTLLLSPSQAYLQSLPLGRLPDRKDFTLKGLDPESAYSNVEPVRGRKSALGR